MLTGAKSTSIQSQNITAQWPLANRLGSRTAGGGISKECGMMGGMLDAGCGILDVGIRQ